MTLRVPCPQGEALDWSEQTLLAVRYADTGEPVPLTSDYQQGWLFATVPAEEAERPLEVFQGEEHRFPDCITVWKGHEYYNCLLYTSRPPGCGRWRTGWPRQCPASAPAR